MQDFILNQDISGDEIQVSDPHLLHQMLKVLRFKPGTLCIVLDGKGAKANGEIVELHKRGARLKLSQHSHCPKPKRQITLYAALSKKPSTFEWIVQKATELGVSKMVPLVTERCQIDNIRKPERLEFIIKEATEQSKRCLLPELADPISLKELLKHPPHPLLASHPIAEAPHMSQIEKTDELHLLIGPEGGFTEEEISRVQAAGGRVAQLGPNILRMETAAIVALAIALAP